MRQQRINGDTASFRRDKSALGIEMGCSKYLAHHVIGFLRFPSYPLPLNTPLLRTLQSWIPRGFKKKRNYHISENPPPEIFHGKYSSHKKSRKCRKAFIWPMFLRQAFPAVDAPSSDNHQISWVLGSQVSTAEFFQRNFMALQNGKKPNEC